MRYDQTSYRAGTSYKLTITSTGAQRTPIMAQYSPVFSVAPTADCWYKIGSSTVTATSTGGASHFVPAGVVLFANKGDNERYVSVIANSANGIVDVCEQTQ